MPHKRLLMKIEKLGITGNLLKWIIQDFLTNRQQRVLINGMSSEWNEVSSGVSQGSVLGPLLFILYVNDIPSEVSSFCKIFADDAKLYKDLQNLEDFEMIQHDIGHFHVKLEKNSQRVSKKVPLYLTDELFFFLYIP